MALLVIDGAFFLESRKTSFLLSNIEPCLYHPFLPLHCTSRGDAEPQVHRKRPHKVETDLLYILACICPGAVCCRILQEPRRDSNLPFRLGNC